ncbi:hypothetical protein BHF70_11660 [Anaerostipes sp. 494a]|uniref:DUF4364 family protein n=1 Tax=Anaerostipes sp. 494a TaxID=1261636 RepID=UPI000951F44A|nr:DUF4364 family protein [Anaerostipes sp. 494a]MDY2727113.1 DUF4364 family protein [Anaerostipes faecalis]OLR60210.1 hypothetical protein BHF70_11660 [Anaerostipes sp. 494a]
MEQNQLTLYKLMILYLIGKVDFPLSNSQVSEFIIEKGYTNYFNVQRAFHELEEEEMLRIKTIRNMSHYSLTEEGKEAIDMFEYQIPNSIKEDIDQFLDEKEYELRKETDLEADFFPAKRDEYTVHLSIKEKDSLLLELNLNVVSREQAVHICDHWNQMHSEIYSTLIQKLLFDDPQS